MSRSTGPILPEVATRKAWRRASGKTVYAVDWERRLGDGLEKRHLVKFLGGIAVLVAARGGGRNDHHRRVSDIGRADAVGQVQNARPIGGEAHAGRARDAAEPVGHQCRALFVANADEAHIFTVVQGIENVEEGRANNAEDVGDAFLLQKFDNGFTGLESLGHAEPPG